MVDIHNFLNEKAWEEVHKWETQVNMCVCLFHHRPVCDVSDIWFRACERDENLQLVRFKGRPGELSPKARFWLFLGWLLPERFK